MWKKIKEEGKFLRVILLPDGETVHNAFFDEAIEEFGLEPIDRLFQAGSYLRGDGSALG
jgi:hypothetical protein